MHGLATRESPGEAVAAVVDRRLSLSDDGAKPGQMGRERKLALVGEGCGGAMIAAMTGCST